MMFYIKTQFLGNNINRSKFYNKKHAQMSYSANNCGGEKEFGSFDGEVNGEHTGAGRIPHLLQLAILIMELHYSIVTHTSHTPAPVYMPT